MSFTPIIGGNFAEGAFKRGMFSEAAGTPITSLSQWLSLGRDPRGNDRIGLRAYISQKDYTDFPGLNKYRSELRGNWPLTPWGRSYWYFWRMVIPPDWVNLGPGSEVIVGQIHDVNAGSVGRRPTVAIEITEDEFNVVWSFEGIPGGQVRAQVHAVAGAEYEVAMRVNWADGTNAPASAGFAETYINGQMLDSFTGLNTWAGTPVTEPGPPYIKCGVYQPGPAFPWWAGKSATMWYPCCMVAEGNLTLADLRAYADAGIPASSARAIAFE